MGALPKRKYAKARQGERRQHQKVTPVAIMNCPQCNSSMQQHHACPTCGYYKGREAVEIKTSATKTS